MNQDNWISLFLALLLQTMLAEFSKAQVADGSPSRETNAAQQSTIEPKLNKPHPNGPALVLDEKLSLEELRGLIHLYSRLNNPKMVEALARMILNRNPRDKETLQLLASFYLERKEASRAIKYARALVSSYPDDVKAHFVLAMAGQLDGRYREAKEILERLKSQKFQHQLFPYESELASAALLSGDWLQAARSFQEALEDPKLQPEQRSEVRNQLDYLYRTHLPQLFLKETYAHFKSGGILRSVLDWSQPVAGRHRLRIEVARDDLKLNPADLLRPQWANRYDALMGIESQYSKWRTRAFGGIGDEGGVYGAKITRILGDDKDLTLAVNGNQRATDSLLLETLGGREDELYLFWHTHFYPEIFANVKMRGRRVSVAGETLGYGYNFDLNVEHGFLKDTPELRVAYRGLITGFSLSGEDTELVDEVATQGASNSDKLVLLKNLVSPINLHGVFLSWQQNLNPQWNWHALGGTDYSFTRSSLGYTFEAGMSYFPNRSAELIFSAGYSTSASTSEQDSERVELNLALRWYF